MGKKLQLVSLGCNKNLVDSEIMLEKLKEYELTDNTEEADVLVINTCGFINPAKEESISAIFELNEKRKEGSTFVVTGCLSERYKEELAREMPEVDAFTGVGDYDKIEEIIASKKNRFSEKTFLQHNEKRVITGSTAHAYIKLSEGCNQKCSFCAIPNFRGKLQSRSLKEIEDELKDLVSRGFYDFTFISQDSSSYGRDLGVKDGLLGLIDAVEKIEGVKSARILYLYPSTLSDEVIERIISSPLFHNYFDMPIQHISDAMLKRMKRGSGKEKILHQLSLMRNAPESFLRSGFIVGHPGESEAEYDELYRFLEEFEFDRISVFAYSDEEGTSAHKMKDKIPEDEINNRIEDIEGLANLQTKRSMQKEVGKNIKVILEGESSEGEFFLSARKLQHAPEIDGEILINDSEVKSPKFGQMYEVHITELVGDKLVGRIEKEL